MTFHTHTQKKKKKKKKFIHGPPKYKFLAPPLRAAAVQMGLVRAAVWGSGREIFVGLVKFYRGCMV